jgi:hypothetical protein
MTITRGLFRLVAGIATIVMVYSCADSARENVLDPVNTPVSEMDAPVLDDGAVLIAFRYIVQRATPSTLTIRRVIDTSSDVIATIPVAPNAGDDWAEVTYRDSAIVAGVPVEYQVIFLSEAGGEQVLASGRLTIPGTRLLISVDTDILGIRLAWEGAPSGRTGYRVLRRAGDGIYESVFVTEDGSVASFLDEKVDANVEYEYVIETLLGSGSFRSSAIRKGLLTYAETVPLSTPGRVTNTYLSGSGTVGHQIHRLTYTDAGLLYVDDVWNTPTNEVVSISLAGSPVPESLSFVGVPFRAGNQDQFYISGYDGTVVFLAAWSDGSGGWRAGFIRDVVEWPETDVRSTGQCVFGTMIGAEKLLLYAGRTIRSIDAGLQVVGEHELQEAPIDIEYVAGSIWLAYADHLVKSNAVDDLASVTSWEMIPAPSGTITRMCRLKEDKLIILDGVAGQMHVVDTAGSWLKMWDAVGTGLEKGDVAYRPSTDQVSQSDGAGHVHVYNVQGDLQTDEGLVQ